MSSCFHFYRIFIVIVCWTEAVNPMDLLKKSSYFNVGDSDSDIAEYIRSKGYLPNEHDLPKVSVLQNVDNDMNYLFSKLSNEELLKLLNEQPKNEYYLNDLMKLAMNSKSTKDPNTEPSKSFANINKVIKNQKEMNKRFQKVPEYNEQPSAFFRLENKQVDPFAFKYGADPKYAAVQNLNNLLYGRPQTQNIDDKSVDDEDKRELMFDVLVAQLKSLCCKKNKSYKKGVKQYEYKKLLNDFISQDYLHKEAIKITNDYMFLIINDEIRSNGSDELISVDPESLEKNSSVLLLGPITTPLTNTQLKLVMSRISKELSKPEYLPLLQQLSEGTLSNDNIRLMKSLVTGPETRRYIKPHRCNHQSKLARIYGGPKWLICTGYLNINTPSLYD